MSSEDYALHLAQKFRLAISLAIINTKPENMSIDQYIYQLKETDDDFETSVCSDDFIINDTVSDNHNENFTNGYGDDKKDETQHSNAEINNSIRCSVGRNNEFLCNDVSDNGFRCIGDNDDRFNERNDCIARQNREKHYIDEETWNSSRIVDDDVTKVRQDTFRDMFDMMKGADAAAYQDPRDVSILPQRNHSTQNDDHSTFCSINEHERIKHRDKDLATITPQNNNEINKHTVNVGNTAVVKAHAEENVASCQVMRANFEHTKLKKRLLNDEVKPKPKKAKRNNLAKNKTDTFINIESNVKATNNNANVECYRVLTSVSRDIVAMDTLTNKNKNIINASNNKTFVETHTVHTPVSRDVVAIDTVTNIHKNNVNSSKNNAYVESHRVKTSVSRGITALDTQDLLDTQYNTHYSQSQNIVTIERKYLYNNKDKQDNVRNVDALGINGFSQSLHETTDNIDIVDNISVFSQNDKHMAESLNNNAHSDKLKNSKETKATENYTPFSQDYGFSQFLHERADNIDIVDNISVFSQTDKDMDESLNENAQSVKLKNSKETKATEIYTPFSLDYGFSQSLHKTADNLDIVENISVFSQNDKHMGKSLNENAHSDKLKNSNETKATENYTPFSQDSLFLQLYQENAHNETYSHTDMVQNSIESVLPFSIDSQNVYKPHMNIEDVVNMTEDSDQNATCTDEGKSKKTAKNNNKTNVTKDNTDNNKAEGHVEKVILANNCRDTRNEAEYNNSLNNNEAIEDLAETEESIPFKVIEELNRAKMYLNRRDKICNSSDTGYRSSSQSKCSFKGSQTSIWVNQSGSSLLAYITTCYLSNQQLTDQISEVLGQLIDTLHEEEIYPAFLEQLLDEVNTLLQSVYNEENYDDDMILTKDEQIQRILLLNKSKHIQKFTIEKINELLRQMVEEILTAENEIENINKIENISYIFHILECILRYYCLDNSSQTSQSSQEIKKNNSQDIRKSGISDIWRRKWIPNYKEKTDDDVCYEKCVLKECGTILNKIVIDFMEAYSLIAYSALKCFNVMQK